MINECDEYMTELLVGLALAKVRGRAIPWTASRLISCKVAARTWEVLFIKWGASKAQQKVESI